MGGSKSTSGPSQSGKLLLGAYTEGLLPGSVEHMVGTQKKGAEVGGERVAGMFSNLNDVANQGSFFGGVAGDPNSPFSTAFNTLNQSFTGEGFGDVQQAAGAGASGASATAGQIQNPDAVITADQANRAIEGLLNPASVFDVMSGGPIVDTITSRMDDLSSAYTQRALQDFETALEIEYANGAAQGRFISSSSVMEQRDRLTRDVMNDINLFNSQLSFDGTKYLGDLAMRDIENGTNALTVVLAQAMVQRGQDMQSAISQAEMITQAAIATAINQTQASIASANNATAASIANANNSVDIAGLKQQGQLGLLGLGLQDSQFQQGLRFDAASKPIDVGAGLAVGSNVSRSKSKTI